MTLTSENVVVHFQDSCDKNKMKRKTEKNNMKCGGNWMAMQMPHNCNVPGLTPKHKNAQKYIYIFFKKMPLTFFKLWSGLKLYLKATLHEDVVLVTFLFCSSTVDKRWDVPSYSIWSPCAHGVSWKLPPWAASGHRSGVFWHAAGTHHVRHRMAEGA